MAEGGTTKKSKDARTATATQFFCRSVFINGSETVILGSQQYQSKDGKGKADVFANAIKHDFRSKNPTTKWRDIIELK